MVASGIRRHSFLYTVQVVCPRLHHHDTVIDEFSPVVRGPQVVGNPVCQLEFYDSAGNRRRSCKIVRAIARSPWPVIAVFVSKPSRCSAACITAPLIGFLRSPGKYEPPTSSNGVQFLRYFDHLIELRYHRLLLVFLLVPEEFGGISGGMSGRYVA